VRVRVAPGHARRHTRLWPCSCKAGGSARHRMAAPVGDGGTGRPARLWTESFQVQVLGAQLLPFGSASARPWYGRVARLDTGEGLHADVAQWSERDLAKVEAPGSRPGIRSHAVVAQQVEHLLQQDVVGSKPVSRSHALLGQLGRAASLRRMTFRVRISGGARPLAGESRPIRSARTGRFACPRPEAAWKVNRPGCRAPLLADARVTPWLSSSPPSSEDEPARWSAPAGNRGVGTSTFLATGTAQLVAGTALIRRQCQVRSLGARLAGSATGKRSGLIHRRQRVQLPSGLPVRKRSSDE
jgi:hypothetical protein